ncbi:hypothetical protein [Azospirillum sp. TSO35-2]|uniref:hypothetical protein n=1 Tax=Azospirillum sp. TSO35-2 TaxID=716796 RepID=UPI000D6445AA|nr:hypothetical protein [Azospirillum sp. TSO35-2]
MWSSQKYFTKGQLYWEHATKYERGSEQFLLNVAFCCEFVVRGAITHVNPALNAANDSDSILYASGIAPQSPPRTIDLRYALDRLQRIAPEITKSELEKVAVLIEARNTELHGDTSEISGISAKEIMPSIYAFLIKACKVSSQEISILIGAEEAKQAEEVAKAISNDRNARVRDWIRIHKDRFFSLAPDLQKEKREKSKVNYETAVLASGRHVKVEKCPSCAELGLLMGVPVGESSPMLRGQEIVKEVRVSPISFVCKCCDLNIKGLDELMSAKFSHEYYALNEIDPIEHFSIDPMDYIDVEEVAREYGSDMYDYQDE